MTDLDNDDLAGLLDLTERLTPGRSAVHAIELDKLQAGFANEQWLIAQGIRPADPVLAAERNARK